MRTWCLLPISHVALLIEPGENKDHMTAWPFKFHIGLLEAFLTCKSKTKYINHILCIVSCHETSYLKAGTNNEDGA